MRLRIFTTGGTIDKVYFDAKSRYEVGAPMVGEILIEAGVGIEYGITELLRKDSLEITAADRAVICAAVEADPAEHILITHGTDTMPETAQALAHIKGKTIVLTGAMSPARFKNSDAVFNIGFAVGAALSLAPGVYVAMNGRAFPAAGVVKNRERGCFEQAP